MKRYLSQIFALWKILALPEYNEVWLCPKIYIVNSDVPGN